MASKSMACFAGDAFEGLEFAAIVVLVALHGEQPARCQAFTLRLQRFTII
jgi:hypothetical protein